MRDILATELATMLLCYCGAKDWIFVLHNKPAKIIEIRKAKMPTRVIVNPKSSLDTLCFFKFVLLTYPFKLGRDALE